mmetsp:Transcript_13054/g.55650  ORF Transcript_13054/g.55650 Transcript_13054/m.55650 type:complete len:335 (-) Transcript_13054:1006-2010(-)
MLRVFAQPLHRLRAFHAQTRERVFERRHALRVQLSLLGAHRGRRVRAVRGRARELVLGRRRVDRAGRAVRDRRRFVRSAQSGVAAEHVRVHGKQRRGASADTRAERPRRGHVFLVPHQRAGVLGKRVRLVEQRLPARAPRQRVRLRGGANGGGARGVRLERDVAGLSDGREPRPRVTGDAQGGRDARDVPLDAPEARLFRVVRPVLVARLSDDTASPDPKRAALGGGAQRLAESLGDDTALVPLRERAELKDGDVRQSEHRGGVTRHLCLPELPHGGGNRGARFPARWRRVSLLARRAVAPVHVHGLGRVGIRGNATSFVFFARAPRLLHSVDG